MENNKNDKNETPTKGNVMKNVASILKLISIPSAIIAGAFILKNGLGKIEREFDFANFLRAELHCRWDD